MPYYKLDEEEAEVVRRCLETMRVGLAGEREGFVLPGHIMALSSRFSVVIERLQVRFRKV